MRSHDVSQLLALIRVRCLIVIDYSHARGALGSDFEVRLSLLCRREAVLTLGAHSLSLASSFSPSEVEALPFFCSSLRRVSSVELPRASVTAAVADLVRTGRSP